MRKKFSKQTSLGVAIVLGWIVIGSSIGRAEKKKYLPVNFSQQEIAFLKPEMLKADFWIQKLDHPDKLIRSKSEIIAFNRSVLKKGYLGKPLNYNQQASVALVRKYFLEDLNSLRPYIKYDLSGKRRRGASFNRYLREITDFNRLDQMKKIRIRFANLIKNVKLRAFPTDEIFVRRPGDQAFDIFVKSNLPLLSVVSILFESKDKKWFYVESKFARGWIKKKYLSLDKKENVRLFDQLKIELSPQDRIVVQSSAPIYTGTQDLSQNNPSGDLKMNLTSLKLSMGTIVREKKSSNPTAKTDLQPPREKRWVEIVFPLSNKTSYWVRESDLAREFLPFTAEKVLRQGFKFVEKSYEWGGGGADRTDCSLLFYYIFRPFGLLMPRSSSLQVMALNQKNITDQKQLFSLLDQTQPLATLAFLSGPNHIMLFLGKQEKRNFFLHSTWSFKDKIKEYLVSSVIVSDLSLGDRHYQGSLAQRTKKIASFIPIESIHENQ